MKQTSVNRMVKGAMIAALYVALGVVFAPISFRAVQMRVAEALTLLPVFSPMAIGGLTLGCALTNFYGMVTGTSILGLLDIFFGSLATLVAAWMTWKLRKITWKGLRILSPLPPILVNGVVIGWELMTAMAGGWNFPIFLTNALSVAAGQLVPCYVLGLVLVYWMQKTGLDQKLF